jgi:hypothetical protein
MSPEQRLRLSEMVRLKLKLSAWCGHCGRYRVMDPGPVARRLKRDATVGELGRKLKCSACGSREVQARPHYGGLGVVSRHDKNGGK